HRCGVCRQDAIEARPAELAVNLRSERRTFRGKRAGQRVAAHIEVDAIDRVIGPCAHRGPHDGADPCAAKRGPEPHRTPAAAALQRRRAKRVEHAVEREGGRSHGAVFTNCRTCSFSLEAGGSAFSLPRLAFGGFSGLTRLAETRGVTASTGSS